MTKKRYIKLTMARGIQRNEAKQMAQRVAAWHATYTIVYHIDNFPYDLEDKLIRLGKWMSESLVIAVKVATEALANFAKTLNVL